MADTASVSEHVRQAMVTLVDRWDIAGGVLPADEATFWREVCVRIGVSPKASPRENAELAIVHLGETWDEDYAEVSGEPSLSAYEALGGALEGRSAQDQALGALAAEEADEEDDSIGPLADGFRANAQRSEPDIATQLRRIRERTLILNPEWQRSFVWKPAKQRRLIESILLGLPIPSFLLHQDSATGKTYVIDGRQRLETISRFCSDPEGRHEPKRRFKTFKATEEGWREGEPLSDAAGKHYQSLPDRHKSMFDGTPLVTFTFRDIPADKLYQIFKRYNTGAVPLNAAEIRNAVYQASPLHQMIYRLAGEHRNEALYRDDEERLVGETLRRTMGSKRERYGTYDFIGRFFAFSYCRTGSVANATNAFMKDHDGGEANALRFQREFVRVFNKTLEWYSEYPLIEPDPAGKFHSFLATVQMVTTRHMLGHVDARRVREEAVVGAIQEKWVPFANERLTEKQNSTLFWGTQANWLLLLQEASAVPRQEWVGLQ